MSKRLALRSATSRLINITIETRYGTYGDSFVIVVDLPWRISFVKFAIFLRYGREKVETKFTVDY